MTTSSQATPLSTRAVPIIVAVLPLSIRLPGGVDIRLILTTLTAS